MATHYAPPPPRARLRKASSNKLPTYCQEQLYASFKRCEENYSLARSCIIEYAERKRSPSWIYKCEMPGASARPGIEIFFVDIYTSYSLLHALPRKVLQRLAHRNKECLCEYYTAPLVAGGERLEESNVKTTTGKREGLVGCCLVGHFSANRRPRPHAFVHYGFYRTATLTKSICICALGV